MKTMTCNQLGGACDRPFHADTFEQLAELSKNHAMEMLQQQDADHLAAMEKMQHLMADPQKMNEWMAQKRTEFDSLPDNEQ